MDVIVVRFIWSIRVVRVIRIIRVVRLSWVISKFIHDVMPHKLTYIK